MVLHLAVGAPQGDEPTTTTTERPHVAILKQINQVNMDGSFTYGFEAADGTFRVETRDIKGNIKGKYGYIDEFGELQTVEYTAGSGAGFNAQGSNIPVPAVPVVRSSGNTDDEFGTDEDWQSVDADEDGIPDPPTPKELRVAKAKAPAAARAPAPVQPQILSPNNFPPQSIPQVGPNQRLIAVPFGSPLPPGFRLIQGNPGQNLPAFPGFNPTLASVPQQ